MNTKYLVIAGAVVAVLGTGMYFVTTDSSRNEPLGSESIAGEDEKLSEDNGKTSPVSTDGSVADGDGFVRLPGEASRGGSGYVVTSDTCEQFTVEYVEGISGKKILRTEAPGDGSACQYYVSETNKNVMFQINVSFLSVANQKTGAEALGRKVVEESRILMDNFVVYQENGLINKIYLILGPNKFIGVDRSSANALTETEIMDLAIKLADKVKDFK